MSLSHEYAETHEVFNQVPPLDGVNLYRIDLPLQIITTPSGRELAFEFDAGTKRKLIAGLDAIGETQLHERAIAAFETQQNEALPWLSGSSAPGIAR